MDKVEQLYNAAEVLRNHCVAHRFKWKGCTNCPFYHTSEHDYDYECILDTKPYTYDIDKTGVEK